MAGDSEKMINPAQVSCPLPAGKSSIVRLAHGSGGKLTSDLIDSVFLSQFANPVLSEMDDAALLDLSGQKLAFTTDSYVVNPIFFPGGNIGSLSVHGTINDLSMRGARPLWLSAAFILEEGLEIESLQEIVASMQEACLKSGVAFVCGDTKVVNKGSGDQIFITTSGIGLIEGNCVPSASKARPGDSIIVSGDLGLHGMAVMCARESLDLETTIESDSAPLNDLVRSMLSSSEAVHCLRDITRGGLASALNELCASSSVGMQIEESAIPVDDQVHAACELLGLDPLYVACEGRLVAIVAREDQDNVLQSMRRHKYGRGAKAIGQVVSDHAGRVVLKSKVGGKRILDKLSGDQLPRIC